MPYMNNPPYYLTAYGLAVKHGFVGSEKKWLDSLKGEPGTGLVIVDSFATEAEMRERYPSGIPDLEGFVRVGADEHDYLLYYWDAEDEDWYSISIVGRDGRDGDTGPAPRPVSESHAYAVSDSGTTPPEGGWVSAFTDPDIVKGKYVWTRTSTDWNNGETTNSFACAYNGADATGAVISINGKDGVVNLVAENIPTADGDNVQEHLDALKTDTRRVNLLDNGFFGKKDAINQRGKTAYHDADNSIYTIDRWQLGQGGTLAVSSNNYWKLGDENSASSLEQFVWDSNEEERTLSIYVAGISGSMKIAIADYANMSDELSITSPGLHVLRSSRRCRRVVLRCESGNYAEILAVKLERGNVQSLMDSNGVIEQPERAAELAKCRKYFQRIRGNGQHVGFGFFTSTGTVSLQIPIGEGLGPEPGGLSPQGIRAVLTGTLYLWSTAGTAGNALTASELVNVSGGQDQSLLYAVANTSGGNSGSPCLAQLRDENSWIDIGYGGTI